ncbi:PAP2 superfamily protein [Frankineae bacterium MT45]|nr:PAP2 superfamily protein [Frankineae bacterium MT45]
MTPNEGGLRLGREATGATATFPQVSRPQTLDRAPAQSATAPPDRLRWWRLGCVAVMVGVVVAAGVVGAIALHTVVGQQLDTAAFAGAIHGQTLLWRFGHRVLDTMSIVLTALLIAIAIAALRRRWLLAVQAALVMGGASLTTELLKLVVLQRPNLLGAYTELANSLPSGHTTVAASAAVTAMLFTPRRGRPAAALLGAAYAAAVGVSTLTGRWHRPSDVVCALLVVGFWGALAALVATFQPPGASATQRPSGYRLALSVCFAVVVVAGLAAGWALLRTASVLPAAGVPTQLGRGSELVAYAGGGFGIVSVTALIFGLLLLLRDGPARRARRPSVPSTTP